jgi:hypothetical protein
MATGSSESDTARQEQLLEDGREGRPLVPYTARAHHEDPIPA